MSLGIVYITGEYTDAIGLLMVLTAISIQIPSAAMNIAPHQFAQYQALDIELMMSMVLWLINGSVPDLAADFSQ